MTLFSNSRPNSTLNAPANGRKQRLNALYKPVSSCVYEKTRFMLYTFLMAALPAVGVGVVAVLSPAERRAMPERTSSDPPEGRFQANVHDLTEMLPADAQTLLGHDLREEPTREEQCMRVGEESSETRMRRTH